MTALLTKWCSMQQAIAIASSS